MTVGGLTAFINALALAIIWIPSAASSVLQFRSGCIGSLRDKAFQKYRVARMFVVVFYSCRLWLLIVFSLWLLSKHS